MFSQNIIGKVYDDDTTAKGIKILNITQNVITFSDDKGDFSIRAAVNDSITFESSFHEFKIIVIKSADFNDVMVVDLKKYVNKLDTILIRDDPKAKPFVQEEYSIELKQLIEEDIKRHPYKYGVNQNGNILNAVSLIISLFKKKRSNIEPFIAITYTELGVLFKTDSFFTKKLLDENLKIPEKYKYLFFDFCDAKQIDVKLLAKKNKFILLEELIKQSTEFLTIIEVAENQGN
jgi:hypothetical protein